MEWLRLMLATAALFAAVANLRLLRFAEPLTESGITHRASPLQVQATARKGSAMWLATAGVLLLTTWPGTITWLLLILAVNTAWDLDRRRKAIPPYTEWGPGRVLEEDRPALVQRTLGQLLLVSLLSVGAALLLGF